MRGSILIKFLKAIDLLSKPEGTTIEEMAEVLGVERRSVYREIEVIEELGFPIYDDKIPYEKRKRWKLDEDYLKKLPNMAVPNINLTLPEIISLYLLKGEGRLYKGTDIEKALDSAFGKIGMFVPGGLNTKLKKVKTLLASSSKFAKDYSGKEGIIDDLTKAMLKQKSCHMSYHVFSRDKVEEYNIDPLNFFENNGGLYIYARDSGKKNPPSPPFAKGGNTEEKIKIFAVERIKELKLSTISFEYPEGFDPDEMLDASFDTVYGDPIELKVWFSAEQARYIKERKWAKEQKITDRDDGSIILAMKSSGWWDVKKWVMSYGAEAKVLEPEKLRDDIVAELEKSLKQYQ